MNKAFLLLIAILFFTVMESQAQDAKHRIVMQLSSGDTAEWKGAVNNLKNLKKGWGSDVEIEVVVHGPGVGFLLTEKTTQHDAIKRLRADGVIFVVCENTLKERKIDKAQVIPEAGSVPMGVGELVLKQEAGWSYLKAGF